MKRLIAVFFLVGFLKCYSQVPAYVPTVGLTGFWTFSGNANDVSGNGNNGIVNGATLTSDRFSAANSAYSFNGTTNYISVPNASSLSGYTDMSISAWIQISSFPSGTQGIVTKWYQANCTSGNTNSDTYEGALSGGQVQFATNNNNLTGFTSPPSLSSGLLNTWVHLVYLSSATQGQSIYINGTLAATHLTSGSICTSTNTLYFGTDYHGTSHVFHRFFSGMIDDIGIWNRVLTNCEIQQLYTSSIVGLSTAGSNTAVCLGSNAHLVANGAASYTWTPGGSNASTITVSPPANTNYTVVGTTTAGCIVSATLALVVNPAPSLSVSTSPASLCSGVQTTLTASGATTYSWSGLGTGTSVVVNPTAPAASFTLIGFMGLCAETSFIFYNVGTSPTLNISSSDTTICQGSSVSISANGGSSYTWIPGNLAGSSVLVNPGSTTIYTVTASNTGSCPSLETWTIFVNPAITISASANPTIVCPGISSTLTATGATSYTWLPVNLTGSVAVVNPGVATNYTVLGDNGTCSASAVVNVSVGFNVSVSSSGNLCNNNSIDLLVSPISPGSTILWTGPGIMGSNNTPTISVNVGGIYFVAVTNTLTNCSGTASISVTSSVNPIVFTIVPSSSVACFPGPAVNMLASVSANLSWFPPAEVSPNTGPLVSVSPTTTTTYTALATLGSCTGSAVITISVNPTPTVITAVSSPSVCSGQPVTIIGAGAINYSWMPGDLSGSSVTVSPLSSQVYTVTGFIGSCVSTATIFMNVLQSPVLTTTASPRTICIGRTTTLTAEGASILAWLLGDPPPLSYSAAVSPTANTVYTVVGSNTLGCTSSATIEVNVINSPAISAVSSNTSICTGESVTLTASGASTYTWLPGLQTSSVIITAPAATTGYTVLSGNTFCSYATVYIFVNNCVNTSFGLTNAADVPEPYGAQSYKIKFTVTAINNSATDFRSVDLTSNLENTFIYPITYTVVNAPTVISRNSRLVVNPSFNGKSDLSITRPLTSRLPGSVRDTLVFTVMINPNGFVGTLKNSVLGFVLDTNNIVAADSSNNGFLWDPDNDGDPTNNNTATPIEIELIELFIPEGFSPDDDGKYDLFVVKGMNGRKARLTIFNRWGNKVFTKEGTELSWDGKANVNALGHDKLPASTYYYIFEFTEGKSKVLHGFLVMQY